MKRRGERVIEWVFALVSAALAWKLDLAVPLRALAETLGARQGGILYKAIMDLGVPTILVGVAAVAMLLYERLIWPNWPWTRCMRGWWIYSLVVRENPVKTMVAGYFFLDDQIDGARVHEGRGFYIEGGGLPHRGDWSAQQVWAEPPKIRALFSMNAQQPSREPLPSHYDGFLEIERTSDTPVIGAEAWYGYFNDLGDRSGVCGPVIAERLRRAQVRNATGAKALLDQHGAALAERAVRRIS